MKYFIKITLRRLSREKVYTVVNIAGLGIGMASALLIFLFLRFETSYDTYHPGHQNIYRIGTDLRVHGESEQYAVSSAPMAPALAGEFDQITSFLRIFPMHFFFRDLIFHYEDQRFYEKEVYPVDSTFFQFFSCRFIEGSPENALSEPFSIVLTREMKERILGNTPAKGQKILLRNAGYFTVTAVIENPPKNTHFQYQGLVSMSSLPEIPQFFTNAFGPGVSWESFERTYGSTVVWAYVNASGDFNPIAFMENDWPGFHEKYITGMATNFGVDAEPIFQPIASIHLESKLIYEISTEGTPMQIMSRQLVRVFFMIALFLILVAIINYTNIAISHFNKRRKEMGIVKILGSNSKQLFTGFFGESVITSFIALVLSLLILELILPWVNVFLNVDISLNFRTDYFILVIIVGLFFFTALFSGLFPAIYFSSTPITRLLVNRFHAGKKSLMIKKILVMVQFAIAAFMISATLVIYKQLNYLLEMDLGYKTEGISAVELHDSHSKSNAGILDSLISHNEDVLMTARSNYIFGMFPIKHTMLVETPEGNTVRSFHSIQTTREYLKIMGLGVWVDGKKTDMDSIDLFSGVLVNREFADSMNIKNPTGKFITTHYQFLEGRMRAQRKIIGMIDNVHYAFLNQPIEPLIIMPMGPRANYLSIKFSGNDRARHKKLIEDAWQQFDPVNPLSYFYIEDVINTFYERQKTLSRLFGYFAFLCVIISFLGVYGITAYNLDQRTLEFGIRKVMGANLVDIFIMLFRDYVMLLVIACAAASAASWYLLSNWLLNFTYTQNITPFPFLLAMILVAFTVFLAIAVHAVRAHKYSPAHALKTE